MRRWSPGKRPSMRKCRNSLFLRLAQAFSFPCILCISWFPSLRPVLNTSYPIGARFAIGFLGLAAGGAGLTCVGRGTIRLGIIWIPLEPTVFMTSVSWT
jgi:hypothetical protein